MLPCLEIDTVVIRGETGHNKPKKEGGKFCRTGRPLYNKPDSYGELTLVARSMVDVEKRTIFPKDSAAFRFSTFAGFATDYLR